MKAKEIAQLTVAQAARLIAGKAISPKELVAACLQQIEVYEKEVKAWVTVLADEALFQAEKAEQEIMRGRYLGPLHGIPYGAKDIYYTKGVRTGAGSRVNPDFIPKENAAVIDKLEGAGAILLGKTTTTEYAFLWGEQKTRNPWNLEHTPGGSSSGSGAAVAASMAMFALGTQTVGSLLRPSAYNNLTCLKPTYGRISRYNVIPCSWSLDHMGAMTKGVEDTAIINEALFGYDARDPKSLRETTPALRKMLKQDVQGMVVGVPEDFFLPEDAVISRRFSEAQEVLKELGVTFKKIVMPDMMAEAFAAHDIVMCSEAAAYHYEQIETKSDLYGKYTLAQLHLGRETKAADYLKAQQVRSIFKEKMAELYEDVDVIITPSTCSLPPTGYYTGSPLFSGPFTNAGLPAMTVPAGFDAATGLPMGLQISAPHMAEEKIIALGASYQRNTSWHNQRPSL